MAATKFLARDLTIEVESETPNSWLAIGGLNTLTHSPSKTDADTTDFDSNGYEEHMVAQRGGSWTLAGFALEDVATGERDPGQVRCEQIARARGLSSLVRFRLTSIGNNRIVFYASVDVTLPGGGNNDAASWQAVVKMSGEPTYTGPAES